MARLRVSQTQVNDLLIAQFTAARAVRDAGEHRLVVLTQRERGVLTLIGHGLTNDDIVTRPTLRPATARTHLSRAMVTLGASNSSSSRTRPDWSPPAHHSDQAAGGAAGRW